jgi:hypothetical protein
MSTTLSESRLICVLERIGVVSPSNMWRDFVGLGIRELRWERKRLDPVGRGEMEYGKI